MLAGKDAKCRRAMGSMRVNILDTKDPGVNDTDDYCLV